MSEPDARYLFNGGDAEFARFVKMQERATLFAMLQATHVPASMLGGGSRGTDEVMTAPAAECPAAIRSGQANAAALWRALNAAQPAHVMGIDPGTRCGWAVLDMAGERVASGVWDLRSKRHEGGGMRYLRCRKMLLDALAEFSVAAVFYEEVRRHAGTSAAHVYGGLIAMIGAVCEERSVPYSAIPVGTVKKAAAGKGNASKAAMVEAAAARWGVQCERDDEADALWIADVGRLHICDPAAEVAMVEAPRNFLQKSASSRLP